MPIHISRAGTITIRHRPSRTTPARSIRYPAASHPATATLRRMRSRDGDDGAVSESSRDTIAAECRARPVRRIVSFSPGGGMPEQKPKRTGKKRDTRRTGARGRYTPARRDPSTLDSIETHSCGGAFVPPHSMPPVPEALRKRPRSAASTASRDGGCSHPLPRSKCRTRNSGERKRCTGRCRGARAILSRPTGSGNDGVKRQAAQADEIGARGCYIPIRTRPAAHPQRTHGQTHRSSEIVSANGDKIRRRVAPASAATSFRKEGCGTDRAFVAT